MSQNRSSAVMAQRVEAHDSLDFFPTPAWATRALMEHVILSDGWDRADLRNMTCWEPACGQGHMAKPLGEYFGEVFASDVHPYGFGKTHDFLMLGLAPFACPAWVITNPPFRLAAEFIQRGLELAGVGVAVLVRTSFIEGVERYLTLFSKNPPALVAPFSERVPMFKGRVDAKGSTATSYCWLVWQHNTKNFTRVRWIPPCRKQLEREGDYA